MLDHQSPSLDQLILMLGDSGMRDGVPAKLHQFGEAAIPPLLEALQDEDEELRYGAVWAIGHIGPSILGAALAPQAFGPCEERLHSDPAVRVRLSALNTLVSIRNQLDQDALVEAFTAALSDEQEQIRAEAARWLGQFKNPSPTARLTEMLTGDESEFVRGRAAYALAYIEPELDSLAKTGTDGINALLTALSDPERSVRLRVIWTLGQLQSSAAIKSLSNILETKGDQNYQEKRKAAEALGQIGDKSAVEALVTALQTETHEGVRSSAAEALGMLKDKRIMDVLIRSLTTDTETSVRASAAKALEALGDTAAVDALIQALDDENDDVQFRAIHALRVLGDARAVEALTALCDDPQTSKQSRVAAERALAAIAK